MKRIGVLTSGGDAPGMNAAIRAVVRTGSEKGWEVFGIRGGYEGLISGRLSLLGPRDVGGIIQRGGTILGSARCPEFRTEEGQLKALRTIGEFNLDGLVIIGGNGSQTGTATLHRLGVKVVGVASTIDNDLYGSDMTIGVDTALNIALEAIDRLKTTASSLQRAFMIEVMGRNCGYLALMAGIAGGAEAVVIPEAEIDPETLAQMLRNSYQKGKAHALVVVAEGATYNAEKLGQYFATNRDRLGFDLRTTIIGHVQRGGAPSAYDRILASRLAAGATECLARDETGVLVGVLKNEISSTPIEDVATNKKQLDLRLMELARILD